MNHLFFDNTGYAGIGIGLFFANLIRYLVIAGVAFVIFYLWKKNKYQHKRIQQKFPENKNYYREIIYSLTTFLIFGLIGIGITWCSHHGLTFIYAHVSDYGIFYFILSILLMLIVHDTYFYWTHRFMHLKKIFPVFHKVHHLSNNPSPWAAFAFHPFEAVIEAGILVLIVFIMPVHPLAILFFLLIMTLMNVLGHLGYELYGKNFLKHSIGKLNNTSTHHNMHHRLVNCNYGLYFNVWDKLMHTNHKDYQKEFETTAAK
jgi:sterol desaturase/sphingolipid hydroxylase (fatty acid hydroxylase superfamily)